MLKYLKSAPMRTQVKAYRVTKDICIEKGRALANGKIGDAGGLQYFIFPAERGALVSGSVLKI